MDKLELKHIIGYFIYRLFILVDDVVCEVEGVDFHQKNTIIAERVNYKLTEVKPVLRPLSDLKKEIEIDGETFIPLYKIGIYISVDILIQNILTGFVEEIVFQMLLRWHFDIYGLIEKGFAVDINTLKK